MIRRWLHRLLRRPGVQRHTVPPLSEYAAEERRILDDYYSQDRCAEATAGDLADRARAALDPDSLPDLVIGVNTVWDRADEIAVERDYSTYRYDYRLPGERVL